MINPNFMISTQYTTLRKKLKAFNLSYQGLRFISFDGSHEHFPAKSKRVKEVLANLDKQPVDAFKTFINLNDEIAIQELRRLPQYHLI